MNLTTFNLRLSRATKSRTIRDLVSQLCLSRSFDRVRPCWTTGSGKWIKNSDHTNELRRVLEGMGIEYTYGNDAPKGGATGQWVALTAKGKRVTALASKEWRANKDEAIAKLQAIIDEGQKERAERYAALAGDNTAVLLQWWKDKAFHPVPEPVLKAKQESGLSWSQVHAMCKAKC